jgi:hypothetical protein
LLKKQIQNQQQSASELWTMGEGDEVIVGKSLQLERPYLRLTKAPEPSEIRPEFVLKKALLHVMKEFRRMASQGLDERFIYAFEQLKSIRQDLTIQRIHNKFTVHVYETHIRVALDREKPDMAEYEQCEKRLLELYEDKDLRSEHAGEFLSFRLLILQRKGDCLSLSRLLYQERESTNPDFLQARKIINLIRNFMYEKAMYELEHVGRSRNYAHDALLEQIRRQYLASWGQASAPTGQELPLDRLLRALGYTDEGTSSNIRGVAALQCKDFLRAGNVSLTPEDTLLLAPGTKLL